MISNTKAIHFSQAVMQAGSSLFKSVVSRMISFIMLLILLSVSEAAFATKDGGVEDDPVAATITDAAIPGAIPWATGVAESPFTQGFEVNSKISHVITFKIYESTAFIPADFDAAVSLKIEYGDDANTTQIIYKLFSINYKKGDAVKKYNAQSYYVVPDAKFVRITILPANDAAHPGTQVNVANGVDPKKFVLLENKLLVTRYYKLGTNVQLASFGSSATSGVIPSTDDHLAVNWTWPANAGYNYTQLEWAWLEDEMAPYYYNVSGILDEAKLFAGNSTRLDLPHNKLNYDIPVLYDGLGKLYVRLRAVNITPTGRADGPWSTSNIYSFAGHEVNLNWQASTSYAEDGKRKTVIQYFDGSLRGRQTVTKDNETQTVVTAETFYDGQGRAAMQILPAPGLENVIKYRADLNRFNGQAPLTQNPSEIFDLEPLASGLQLTLNNTLANSTSKYYSVNNPESTTGVNKNIPDAEGYPYALTRFTPDGTGRVMAQSGVGPNYTMGSGKETKYYYGVPSQEELDALFGTEVGTYSHYSKNMVKDANKQMSVSYVDMHGRTIATALAGDSPGNLTEISRDAVNYPNQNLTDKISMNLLDNTTNVIKNNSTIESVNSILVSAVNPNPYDFTYKLSPETFTQANCVGGSPTSLCYECLYDLEITITDESGETLPKIRRYTNISLNAGITDNCSGTTSAFTIAGGADNLALAGDITNGNTIKFTEPLIAGSYSVRKTLSISESSLQTYKDLYMSKQVCKSEQDYINETYAQLSTSTNCIAGTPNACAACSDAQGLIYVESRFGEFTNKYLNDIGLTTATAPILNEIRTSFDANKATCALVCNTSSQSLPTIRQLMIEDMRPYTGQYALSNTMPPASSETDQGPLPDVTSSMYNTYNIFAVSSQPISYQPFFRNPVVSPYNPANDSPVKTLDYYYNNQGNLDATLYPNQPANDPNAPVDKSFLAAIPEADFAQQFSDSWLASLLPHHPEYKRLQFAENKLSASNDWINNFQEASYATATDPDPLKDYVHPLANDPFFLTATGKLSAMTASIDAYPGTSGVYPGSPATRSLSMWQMAYGDAAGCKIKQDPTDRQTCYINSSLLAVPNPVLTATQNAQAWQIFKGLYVAERERLVNEYISEQVPLADDEALVTQGYHLWFPKDNKQTAEQNGWASWWPDNPGDGPKTDITAPPGLPLIPAKQYESTCGGYIDMWKNKLLQCDALNARSDKDAILTEITNRMKVVCINGSDQANPYGASNVSLTLAGNVADKSFEDVIKNVFTTYGIIVNGVYTDNYCNPFVIDWPKPYSKSPKLFGGEQAVLIDDCGCAQFTKLKAEALAANYDPTSFASLNTYLNLTYNQALTTTMFEGLLKCGYQSPCQKCAAFSQVVEDYNNTYPNGGLTACAPLVDSLPLNSRANSLPAVYEARKTIEFLPGFETFTDDHFETLFTDSSTCDPLINCRQDFTAFFNTHYNNNTPLTWDQIEAQFIANCGASPSICGNKDYSCAALKRVECTFIGNSTAALASTASITVTTFAAQTSLSSDPQTSFVDYFNNYYHNNPLLTWNDINTLYTNGACDANLSDHISLAVPYACTSCTSQAIVLPAPEPMPDFLKCGFVAAKKCLSCAAISAYTAEYKTLFANAPAGAAPVSVSTPLTADQVAYNANFARFINYRTGYQYSWAEYAQKADAVNCILNNYAANTNATQDVVCGNPLAMNDPQNLPQPTDPCADVLAKATAIGQEKYRLQKLNLLKDMEAGYRAKCLGAVNIEEFAVTWSNKEYHYTLYYYDMAGNLVKTVAPKGVMPIYNNTGNSGNVSFGDPGTVSTMAGDAFHALVKASRLNEYNVAYTPVHQFTTDYRYNSLNKVVVQNTPDAAISSFWYDALGRLVISQNAKQKNAGKYSYTKYDDLGRIKEVGQITNAAVMTDATSKDNTLLANWFAAAPLAKEQITRTTYDVLCQTVNPLPIDQQNLRNRVSFSQYFDTDPDQYVAAGAEELEHHASATYYSYDVHGNVDVLVQDYKTGIMNATGNRFKKLTYDYDLISGKVNEVAYQPDQPDGDAFYHRYSYDAENRITDVQTSKDKILWENDAHYNYYKHGPLARTVLGELQVQGMDYAYTLQGWLKGVNSTSLNPLQDIGGDGIAGSSVVARDVIGFALHYYDDASNTFDYKPIVANPNGPSFARPSTGIGFAGKSLFNGNIAGITMNNGGLANGANGTVNASPLFYMYGYDQLNRLVNMQAYTGLVTTGNSNTWPATPQATNDYKEQISYDPNGNIVSYNRNGATGITPPSGFTGGQSMDQLSYRYYYYDINNNKLPYNPTLGVPAGGRGTNQLSSVGDQVPSTNYADDIDDQVNTDNYDYDEIGNLVIDKAEGLYNPTIANPAGTAIEWNVYGKIAKITKIKAGTTTVITYRYDVSGNRISKQVTQSGATTGDKTTLYVRDASGNVMSIYEAGDPAINNSSLTQTEVHLYGSSRLGLMNVNVNVQSPIVNTTGITIFERANKVFELTNHLGNVLVIISDKKIGHDAGNGTIDYYNADVVTAQDYYVFGGQMPGRKYQQGINSYRYGFGGQEKSNEIKGEGNSYTAEFWEYDPRVGRRWNLEPLATKYPNLSGYAAFGNNPILFSDPDGKDIITSTYYVKSDGTTLLIKKTTIKGVYNLGTMSSNSNIHRKADILQSNYFFEKTNTVYHSNDGIGKEQPISDLEYYYRKAKDAINKPSEYSESHQKAGYVLTGGSGATLEFRDKADEAIYGYIDVGNLLKIAGVVNADPAILNTKLFDNAEKLESVVNVLEKIDLGETIRESAETLKEGIKELAGEKNEVDIGEDINKQYPKNKTVCSACGGDPHGVRQDYIIGPNGKVEKVVDHKENGKNDTLNVKRK